MSFFKAEDFYCAFPGREYPNANQICFDAAAAANAKRDAELERLRAENERLATDALATLSKYTATAVEGYRVAPHMLATDIDRLGRERDRLREALGFYADRGTWCMDEISEDWTVIPSDDIEDVDGDNVGGKRARAALAGGTGES